MLKTKKELLAMDLNDMPKLLEEVCEKLAKIRIQHRISPLKNNQLISKYKQMVARIKTIMGNNNAGVTDE